MNKFTLRLKIPFSLLFCAIFMAFSWDMSLNEELVYIQNKLLEHYDSTHDEEPVKRYQLNVTNNGFCRYRKYYISGKVEYFSFNLVKFKELDYYGTDQNGKLYLRTKGEQVIVQTYGDKRNGDIDSMANYMMIPLKNIEPQDLVALSDRLIRMNALLLAQK